MSDQSRLGLGHIITSTQQRDAIHIAVAPIVAAERLAPGTNVGLKPDGTATNRTDTPVGVVDPFLKQVVLPGETFWLFLYPGTVTGLRHEWAHPAFTTPTPFPASDKEASVQWLTGYAKAHMEYINPNDAYERFISNIRSGYIHYEGQDMHSVSECDDLDELLKHLSVVLERPVTANDFSYSCSC